MSRFQEKKPGNRCDGSCAGIQYFNCLPGFGIFTTIEKIIPKDSVSSEEDEHKPGVVTDLDVQLRKNILCFEGENKLDKPRQLTDSKKTFKTSLSLQNISDAFSVNTNNDFDQNTILQPEKTQLLLKVGEKKTNKNEVDLIDTIGGIWSGTTEQDKLPSYSNLKKTLFSDKAMHSNSNTTDRNSSYRTTLTKTLGSKTMPKKTKLHSKENSSPSRKSNFYIGSSFSHLLLAELRIMYTCLFCWQLKEANYTMFFVQTQITARNNNLQFSRIMSKSF